MIEVLVDGNAVRVPRGVNVLQACEAGGVDIPRYVRRLCVDIGGLGGVSGSPGRVSVFVPTCPTHCCRVLPTHRAVLPLARPSTRRFCYHQRLSIAGNCRMCLVEVEKSPKPVASCAMPANPGMNIKTNTPLVKKAREGVMEFLLANHPLDCPICDQGGECDLQDQAMMFGSDRSRFTEAKRTVVDKNLGPLVKTVMTRCIHCTRCVRFAKEVAGIEDLGVTGRGRDAEIGTYVQKTMQSELSGNVVDLCPVGALTSKPTAFTYRSWELRSTDTVDVSDALGSNIRVDARGSEVMRVMPRLNDDINQEWISDKTRYQFDGLRYQRLVSPMVKSTATGKLEVCDWPTALAAAAAALRGAAAEGGSGIRAIAGKLADVESMVLLKDLMNAMGCEDVRHENFGDGVQADVRSSYLFNGGLRSVDDADAVILIGTNPRKEAPVLNARIRAQAVYGGKVGVVGDTGMDLTYPYEHLSEGVSNLSDHARFFEGATSPMVIVGSTVFRNPGAMAKARDFAAKTGATLSVLHDCASAVGALDAGFVPGKSARDNPPSKAKVVYLLNADDYVDSLVDDGAFVIYQGHHGDKGAARADVVLPAAAYTEKYATYVNTEGRAQTTKNAVSTLADSRVDWEIVRALSEVCGATLPVENLEAVRARMAEVAPSLARRNELCGTSLDVGGDWWSGYAKGAGDSPISSWVDEFYMTDVISRASKVMARCVKYKQS